MKEENEKLKQQYKLVTKKDFILEDFLNKDLDDLDNYAKNSDKDKDNPKVKAKLELENNIKLMRNEVELLKQKHLSYELQSNNMKNENIIIKAKINNLENIFIGSNIIRNKDGSTFNNMANDYNLSSVRKRLILFSFILKILNWKNRSIEYN